MEGHRLAGAKRSRIVADTSAAYAAALLADKPHPLDTANDLHKALVAALPRGLRVEPGDAAAALPLRDIIPFEERYYDDDDSTARSSLYVSSTRWTFLHSHHRQSPPGQLPWRMRTS